MDNPLTHIIVPPQQFTITHLGGEHCVTGSCHLLQIQDLNILVDCGIAQGNDQALPFQQWPVRPSDIDYLFITHAHLDHIGRIPQLIANDFNGEIICSHPTSALLSPMLKDAMGVAGLDQEDIKKYLQTIETLAWGFEYNTSFSLKRGIKFKLGKAGHILGSSFINFIIPVKGIDSQSNFSVIFSGDLGHKNTPILVDPDPPDRCDLLVLESTYGDRRHESRTNRLDRLNEILAKALSDNGKVFIPAFALGRTQELLYELDRLFSNSQWGQREIPVFVDSPLGLSITERYSALSDFWNAEARHLSNQGDHPFDFKNLYSVAKYKDHQRLLKIPGPAIIIAGSGMCTGGRIIDHLITNLTDPANDIFFIGYQAKGTLGREIVTYSPQAGGYVWINHKKIPIRAKIHNLSGYSGHADQQDLIDWVKSMPRKPGKIKLVHGAPQARKALSSELQKQGYYTP